MKVVAHSDYLDAAYNDVFKGFVSVFRLEFNPLPCYYTVYTFDEYYQLTEALLRVSLLCVKLILHIKG